MAALWRIVLQPHKILLYFALALWSVIVAGALLPPAAFAVPEWFQRGAVITNNLKLDAGGARTPEFINAQFELKCGGSRTLGEIERANRVIRTKMLFVFCEGKRPGGARCEVNSPRSGREEINTEELSGVLGEVAAAEATSERGIELKPVNRGNVFAEIEGTCVPRSPARITGNIIGEISPVRREERQFTLTYSLRAGRQAIREFRGMGGANFLTAFGEEFPLEWRSTEVYFEVVENNCLVKKKIEIT